MSLEKGIEAAVEASLRAGATAKEVANKEQSAQVDGSPPPDPE